MKHSLCAARIRAFICATVGAGGSFDTIAIASSTSTPVAAPSLPRITLPPAVSFVSFPMPASASAFALAIIACPSMR